MEATYFLHISDTHFGPTADYALGGKHAIRYAEAIVSAIQSLPVRPHFLVHTGDVATDPSDFAYQTAARVFGELSLPKLFVCGNHDSSAGLRSLLTSDCPKGLEFRSPTKLVYSWEFNGHRTLVLDALGPKEIDAQGELTPDQFELLESEITAGHRSLSIFIHFPPINLDSTWLDSGMLLRDGERFHKIVARAKPGTLRGVFFGHIHRGISVIRDGVHYVGVASTCLQFNSWPKQTKPTFDQNGAPGFQFVSLLEDRTLIRQYTVAI
jgi:Icc protein